MTDLPLLIPTLEEAGEGSRELDAEVWFEIGWNGQGDERPVPPLTTSIDAALALIGERLPGARWRIEHLPPSRVLVAERPFWATCGLPGEQESACAATPALALCLALCRALQSQGETHDA